MGIFHATEIRYQLIIFDEHPVKLWVRTPFMVKCTWSSIM